MPGSDARNDSRRASRRTGVRPPGARAAPRSALPPLERSAERVDAERAVLGELEAWRAGAVPDSSASFDAEALAHLVRACLSALGVGPEVGAGFSVNTVHYYRRKDILDEPAGRTSSARYDVRHLWQAVGARLAGHLGLVTLAEARDVMRGADEETLLTFVAARVVDARSRQLLREATAIGALFTEQAPAPRASSRAATVQARPLPGVITPAPLSAAVVIPLPNDAWCILPASHPARRSPAAADELVRALATALGLQPR